MRNQSSKVIYPSGYTLQQIDLEFNGSPTTAFKRKKYLIHKLGHSWKVNALRCIHIYDLLLFDESFESRVAMNKVILFAV